MLKWNRLAMILPTTNGLDSLSCENTAPEVVNTFLRGKERDRLSLRPRKRIWEIVLVGSLVAFYLCRLVKIKVRNNFGLQCLRKGWNIVPRLAFAFFGVLCCLGGPLLVSPLGDTEGFWGVSLSAGFLLLWKPSLVFLDKCYECVLLLGHKG